MPFEARARSPFIVHCSPFAIKGPSGVRRPLGSEALTINLTPTQIRSALCARCASVVNSRNSSRPHRRLKPLQNHAQVFRQIGSGGVGNLAAEAVDRLGHRPGYTRESVGIAA